MSPTYPEITNHQNHFLVDGLKCEQKLKNVKSCFFCCKIHKVAVPSRRQITFKPIKVMKIFKFKDENEENDFYEILLKFLLCMIAVMFFAFMEYYYQHPIY